MGLIQRVKMWWNRPSDAVTIASLAQRVYDNDRTYEKIFDYIHEVLDNQDSQFHEIEGRIEIGSQNIASLFQTVNGQSRTSDDTAKRLTDLHETQVVKLNYYIEKLDQRLTIQRERVDTCIARAVAQSERMDAHEKDCLDYDVVIQEMEDDITESKAVIERQQKQIEKLAATVDTLAKEAFHRVQSPYEPLPPMGIPKKRTTKLVTTHNTPKKGVKSK